MVGVGKTGYPLSPTSEPDVWVSHIRRSGRWVTALRIDGVARGRPPYRTHVFGASHPSFEGRQHAISPDRALNPAHRTRVAPACLPSLTKGTLTGVVSRGSGVTHPPSRSP